jgi:NRPS condensation-like uncharacterized protein
MSKNGTDPISPWFILCEELDEYIGIRFGRVAPGMFNPEWMFVRHTDFDGIGGFAELLRRRGAVIPRLPQIKHPAPASKMSLVRALPKFLKPRRRVKWGQLERGPVHSSSREEAPKAVAWHIFDEQTTTQIKRVCRKKGFTVNSFLLKHLNKAIRPFLQDQSSIVPWMVPINMRGKVIRDRDTANYTSYVGVKIASYETVDDVHAQIYKALGRGEHWANWYAYDVSRPLTKGMKKFMLQKDLAMSQWNIGSFSNLGDWDSEKTITQSDCEGSWLFAPPVLRCQLVGAGCVTYQNRLTLTIQAHSDLTNSSAVPRAWIQTWVKEIDIDLTSILVEAHAATHWMES